MKKMATLMKEIILELYLLEVTFMNMERFTFCIILETTI